MQNWTRLVVLVALFCYSVQSDLPSGFQKCKRSGDDFNGCLKVAIQDALPKYANGFPDLGVPKFEPMYIPEATIGEGATGAVRVVQHYSDINLYNFSRTRIDKIEAVVTDVDFKLTIEALVPELIWDSGYDFSGQILLLPISGKGRCYGTSQNIKITISFVGEIYEKMGEKYIKINTAKVDSNPEGFRVRLENLFNGNERLGEEMNKILNSNWEELWADTKPNYQDLFKTMFIDYANRLFKKVPLNNMFPL